MRFRLGFLIGLAVGYYFGAKAGRDRYIEMRRWLLKARDSEPVEMITSKAHTAVEHGVERVKDLVNGSMLPPEPPDAAAPSGPGTYSPSR